MQSSPKLPTEAYHWVPKMDQSILHHNIMGVFGWEWKSTSVSAMK